MNPAVDNEFQQWLSQINQVCGNFTGRLLTERYTGVLDTHFAKGLKLSTVTTSGVNLSRTWQEVKGSDDAWFYTVFQLVSPSISGLFRICPDSFPGYLIMKQFFLNAWMNLDSVRNCF